MAFIFADLIVLPIIAIYRKYYGWAFTVRITALMFITMAAAALMVDAAFTALGLVPDVRPPRRPVRLDPARLPACAPTCSADRLRRALWAHDAPRRDRPGLWHEGRPLDAASARARRHDVLLLLRALHAPVPGGCRRARRLTGICDPDRGTRPLTRGVMLRRHARSARGPLPEVPMSPLSAGGGQLMTILVICAVFYALSVYPVYRVAKATHDLAGEAALASIPILSTVLMCQIRESARGRCRPAARRHSGARQPDRARLFGLPVGQLGQRFDRAGLAVMAGLLPVIGAWVFAFKIAPKAA